MASDDSAVTGPRPRGDSARRLLGGSLAVLAAAVVVVLAAAAVAVTVIGAVAPGTPVGWRLVWVLGAVVVVWLATEFLLWLVRRRRARARMSRLRAG